MLAKLTLISLITIPCLSVTPQQGGKREQLNAEDSGPAVGTKAPKIELKTPDGKKTLKLSELHKEKPVVLVFGSYT